MSYARYTLYVCPSCDYHGISGVSGGVGPWPGDGKVRCPSRICEYRTVMQEDGALYHYPDLLKVLHKSEAPAALRWIELNADVPADYPNQAIRLRQIRDRAHEALKDIADAAEGRSIVENDAIQAEHHD